MPGHASVWAAGSSLENRGFRVPRGSDYLKAMACVPRLLSELKTPGGVRVIPDASGLVPLQGEDPASLSEAFMPRTVGTVLVLGTPSSQD